MPNFLKIRQRVSELSDPEKRHFPLESFIALTTVSALPCRTVIGVVLRVAPDLSSGKSRVRPFLGNLAKSSSSQISSWIWPMPLQLHYIQLITNKTSTADLPSSGVFAILISVTRKINIQNPLPFHKFPQKLASSDVSVEALICTALYNS